MFSTESEIAGRAESSFCSTVARLDELYQNHPDTPKVAAAYAKGLCNLTVVQGSKDCTATVARLDTLYQSHPDSEDIVSAFVVCLLNVALHQKSESEIRNILARSSAVLDRYPKNSNIQLFHAMIWFVLTLRQHEIDISATAADIANFLHSNTGIIPKFKEALDKYLSAHPDYAVWYQPLLYL